MPVNSEQVLGLMEQPEITCGMIDDLVTDIMQNVRDRDEETAMLELLEKIRKRAEEIRHWGQDWKDEALRQHQIRNTDEYREIMALRKAPGRRVKGTRDALV